MIMRAKYGPRLEEAAEGVKPSKKPVVGQFAAQSTGLRRRLRKKRSRARKGVANGDEPGKQTYCQWTGSECDRHGHGVGLM